MGFEVNSRRRKENVPYVSILHINGIALHSEDPREDTQSRLLTWSLNF